jgi:hypothetical protein
MNEFSIGRPAHVHCAVRDSDRVQRCARLIRDLDEAALEVRANDGSLGPGRPPAHRLAKNHHVELVDLSV